MINIRYAVCSIERVGSGYLCGLLSANGLGRPSERLCARSENRLAELEACRAQVEAEDTVNAVFGTKLFPGDWLKWENDFPATHLIRLRRLNFVHQAISLYLARRTDSWRSIVTPTVPASQIPFNADEIMKCYNEVVEHNRFWDSTLAGRNHLIVIYENLCADPAHELARIFNFFERPLSKPLCIESILKKQRDESQVLDWTERLRDILPIDQVS